MDLAALPVMKKRMMACKRIAAGLLLFPQMTFAASADACHEALAVFNYPLAADLAQAQLAAGSADAWAGMCAARAAYETGHFATALETSQQNLATALHNLAGLAWARGNAVDAIALYRESIPINPDLSERSASYNNIGLIRQAQGQLAEAEYWLEQAIALNREHDHSHHLGKHLMNLGNLYREEKRYAEAASLLDEGVALIDRAGDIYWQAVAARYRGWLARDQGDEVAAAHWLARAAHGYDAAGAGSDAGAAREELSRLWLRAY
jgi:tetratricopeptide (TPR) repeat protein